MQSRDDALTAIDKLHEVFEYPIQRDKIAEVPRVAEINRSSTQNQMLKDEPHFPRVKNEAPQIAHADSKESPAPKNSYFQQK